MSEDFPSLHEALPKNPPSRSAFGGLGAFLWCLGYMLVMQVLAGLVCGTPLFVGAAMLERQSSNGVNLEDPMSSYWMVIATMVTLICSHLAGLGCGWFALRWRVGKSWQRRIAFNRKPFGLHLALIAIGFPALLALATLVDSHLTNHIPSMNELLKMAGSDFKFGGLDQMMNLFRLTPIPLALLAVAVLPALNEELWCRGFLAQGLSQRYSVWPTVIITSMLFGFLHVDPRQAAGTVLLALAIHFGYLATKSFWMAVLLHLLNNACVMIHLNEKLNLPILRPFEEMAERSPLMLLGGALALFIPVAYTLWQTRSVITRLNADSPSWKPRSKGGAELPPDDSGYGLTHEPAEPINVVIIVAGALVFGLVTVVF